MGKANFEVVDSIMKYIEDDTAENGILSYERFRLYEITTMIEHPFSIMNIPFPPKEKYAEICRELESFVIPKIKASPEGIIDLIRNLHKEGYKLHTASGETSWMLKEYLKGMGVIECFSALYGPDIIGIMKGSEEYYQKILVHANVDPQRAIFIDDKPNLLALARNTGALTIQACYIENYPSDEQNKCFTPSEVSDLILRMISANKEEYLT